MRSEMAALPALLAPPRDSREPTLASLFRRPAIVLPRLPFGLL